MSPVVIVVAKVTLVLVMGLVATWALRRRSAALRHAVITSSVLTAALIPVFAAVTPAWLPALTVTVEDARTDTVSVHESFGGAEITTPSSDHSRSSSVVSGASLAMGAWLIVAGVALTRLARDLWHLRGVERTSLPFADSRVATALASLPAARRCPRTTLLRACNEESPVFTWGVRKPRILLPPSATTWSDTRLRSVLAHELAHVARRDWLWLIVVEVARALYYWHPLMWIAVRTARREAEHACDDAVVDAGEQATSYAQTLIDLARSTRAASSSVVTALTPVSFLERRITAMLDTTIDHAPARRLSHVLLAIPLLASAVAIAGMGVQASAQGAGTVTGTVRPSGGNPIADVEIVFTGAHGETRVRTDVSGEFSVDLPAGVHRAAIRLRGFKPFDARVDVTNAGPVRRDFALALGSVRESVSIAGGGSPDEVPAVFGMDRVTPRDHAATVTAPIKTREVPPAYPAVVRDGLVAGDVVLSARIGADGHVTDIAVVSSPHDDLSAAAIAAVEQWKYEPTLVQGDAVSTDMTVRLAFEPPADR